MWSALIYTTELLRNNKLWLKERWTLFLVVMSNNYFLVMLLCKGSFCSCIHRNQKAAVAFWTWWGTPSSWARLRVQVKWEVSEAWRFAAWFQFCCYSITAIAVWWTGGGRSYFIMATVTKPVIFHPLEGCPEGQTQQFSTQESSLPPKSPSVREPLWALLYYNWGCDLYCSC